MIESIPFTKMHGIGNDFVLIDNLSESLSPEDLKALSVQACHRRYGVGSDGLIVLEPSQKAHYRMRMFNPDGSESEACGNGTRCFAHYLLDKNLITECSFDVETTRTLLNLKIEEDRQVTVNMGKPKFTRKEIGIEGPESETFFEQPFNLDGVTYRGTAASMGNPHLVFFVQDVKSVPLEKWGPLLENHPLFSNKTNVHFAQILNNKSIVQRTWERGAGVTLACGSGACAVAVAAYHTQNTERQVTLHLPGGDLQIDYQEDGNTYMTGPATTVFEGVWISS